MRNQDLHNAHKSLLANYGTLKSDNEELKRRMAGLEKERRRHSQEEQEVTERMDMVLQVKLLLSGMSGNYLQVEKDAMNDFYYFMQFCSHLVVVDR